MDVFQLKKWQRCGIVECVLGNIEKLSVLGIKDAHKRAGGRKARFRLRFRNKVFWFIQQKLTECLLSAPDVIPALMESCLVAGDA